MAESVWVVAEQWRGQLSETTFEALALGQELSSVLGAELRAVLLGHDAKGLADSLGMAEAVLSVNHPLLAEPTPEVYCEALRQLIQAKQPRCVLIPLTNVSMDMAALLPAQLGAAFVNWCKDVRVADGQVEARSLLYGGKMEARVRVEGKPAILGILPGCRPAEKGRSERKPVVEEANVTLADAPRVRLTRYIEPEAGDVDITKQRVLIAVGRGIQTQENLELAEELAQSLGGAVCGSRPVIDQGWLPLSRQVGKSGATVKPKLYLAAGISGAPEHVEGMKNAELIIAINSDPNAPIFQVAHYGVVADCLELLQPLTEEVRKAAAGKVKG